MQLNHCCLEVCINCNGGGFIITVETKPSIVLEQVVYIPVETSENGCICEICNGLGHLIKLK